MKTFISFAFSLFLIGITYAQTGPAGVGNSSNNVIWLNSETYTFSSIPNVSAWPDQSGNGNDFVQATSSRQPHRVTYYGHQALRFDGGDWIRNGGAAGLNSANHTQYIVYNGNKANHTGIIYDGSFAESSQFYRTYRTGGNVNTWTLNGSGGTEQNSTANNSAFQIISSVRDGSAETWTSFQNGTSFGTQTGVDGSPSGNFRNTIGAAQNSGYRFDGDIGEVIMYNAALNSAQRTILDNYLSSKFKIAIVNDNYAYDVGLSHQYQLFGVGQEADGNNLVAQGQGIVEIDASGTGMANGEYILSGHDNTDLSQTTNDVPAAISGGTRITRTWRVGVTGAPGAVDVNVDVSGLPLSAGAYYFLVDDDGDFSNGGTTEHGPVVDVGGIASFSGVSFSDGNYYSIGTSNGSAIVSVQTGYWDVAGTWNCNCVPGASDDVTITSGHTVTARTTTNVNNIDIDGSLNTQTTGSFNVKGDYTVNATGTVVHKTILFNGSGTQNLTNNSATPADLASVVVANNIDIVSGAFEVTNSANVSTGQFSNTGGSCTFVSDGSSTAVIVNGAGGFSGNFTMQRHISTRNASWGDLSSPVSGLTLGQWDSDQSGTVTEIYMSNVGGVDGNAGNFFSVWDWNEATQSYDSIIDTSYTLPVGKSIEIWLEDSNSTWEAKTIDSRGTPNSGSIPIGVVNSWNLVGNPYHAFIDWSDLTKPTLNNTYYIWNTNNASYDAKTSGLIPPNQGFWVESVGAGTLTFTESAKTGSGQSIFYRSEEPVEFTELKLKVTSDVNTFAHELKLRLNNLATAGYDEYDGSFLKSRVYEAPSITTFANDAQKELAISSFNYQDEINLPIKINVGVTGEYFIEPINVEVLSLDFEYIELIDHQTGMVYNLKGATKGGVSVEIDENENTERFTLRLSNLNGSATVDADAIVDIYKNSTHTIIEIDNVDLNYEVSIYNAIGQKVMENIMNTGSDKLMIDNNKFPQGMNIITVRTRDGKVVSEKLTY